MVKSSAFAETVATYRDVRGAEAFIAKERVNEARRNAQAYEKISDLDVRGWKVLDVGCGFGRDVGEFRRRGAEAYGCDVSPVLLDKAREMYGPWFVEDDILARNALPFGGEFDLLWCCSVFVHVPREEMTQVLERLWKGLKPGGRLLLWTKQGEGERVMENLGAGLPRVMVYYRMADFTGLIEAWGGVVEMKEGNHAQLPTGDSLLFMRVRKPL